MCVVLPSSRTFFLINSSSGIFKICSFLVQYLFQTNAEQQTIKRVYILRNVEDRGRCVWPKTMSRVWKLSSGKRTKNLKPSDDHGLFISLNRLVGAKNTRFYLSFIFGSKLSLCQAAGNKQTKQTVCVNTVPVHLLSSATSHIRAKRDNKQKVFLQL